MHRALAALATLAVLCAIPAAAQQLGLNGGLLGVPVGGHQAELVLAPLEMTVYILEDGKAHDTQGAKIRAVIQQSGIELVPQQGKRLVGELEAPIEKGAIVIIAGKDKHGDAITGRFVIK